MKRDTTGEDYHPPGYRTMHGIEARMMSFNCGRAAITPFIVLIVIAVAKNE